MGKIFKGGPFFGFAFSEVFLETIGTLEFLDWGI